MNKKIIFFTFFFLFLSTYFVKADNPGIYFVDVDKIMTESKKGKKIIINLDKTITTQNKKFKDKEQKLIKEEELIIKQKNVLSAEELNKKISEFKLIIKKFNIEKKDFNQKMNKQRIDATNQMLISLNKILSEYASQNSISLIIQKKNIIIGKTDLDITEQVMKIFNEQIK
jgi:Skp family chaperone for outer membrane proteins